MERMLKKNSSIGKTVHKKKPSTDDKNGKRNRFLITINVMGSAGPLRFVVNEDDHVVSVVETALKSFAREGRLPVLGFDVNNFLLYCADGGSEAMSPSEEIGKCGGRSFVLCKKQSKPQMTESRSQMVTRKRKGWKAWLLRHSFNFEIFTH